MTKEELILYSPYPKRINQEIEWFDNNDYYRYKDLIRNSETCKRLRENGWLTNKFTYNFDGRGFRIPSSDIRVDRYDQDILFIGESFVFGVGLPWEEIFAVKASKKLQMNPIICAKGGISINGCFRFASYWIERIKPSIVFLLVPPPNRFDMVGYLREEQRILVGSTFNDNGKKPKWFMEFHEKWAINEENGVFNNKANTLAIEKIAEQNGCKFATNSMLSMLHQTEDIFAARGKEHDWAKDLLHWGKESNDVFCDIALEKIERQTT